MTTAGTKNGLSRAVILFIAQGAYSGRSLFAPGTAGTLVGVLLYLIARNAGSFYYMVLTLLLCVVGAWAADRAEIILGKKDSPSIVIDEIAGYFVAMAMVPAGWGLIIAGFVLFRIFDILKPWPLYDLQRARGGLGVMLDDIGAGIYTNILLQIAALLVNR